jgi:hypothetical protein
MAEKLHFSYRQIHKTVKRLAQAVISDGYDPDVIVAIGTGGFIPARILKTFIDRPILTVGLRLYDENNQPTDIPRKVQWIDEVEQKLAGKRILLVDEVDDTRTTLEYCLRELLSHSPQETAVAVLHRKNKAKRGRIPESVTRYYAGEDLADQWIVYPWDADDIDAHTQAAEAPEAVEPAGRPHPPA